MVQRGNDVVVRDMRRVLLALRYERGAARQRRLSEQLRELSKRLVGPFT